MARRRLQAEIWNATNSARLAIFAAPIGGTRRDVLGGESLLSLTVPLSDPASDLLQQGVVLRLQREGAASVSAWRVQSIERNRGEDNALIATVFADALWMDFVTGHVHQPQVAGRPDLFEFGLVDALSGDVLTDYLIASYEGSAVAFTLGVVDAVVAAGTVSLSFNGTTPLEALRMLEAAAECEAQFRLSTDGATYEIDLLERIGNAAGGPELRYGKNVRGITRIEDYTNLATRMRIRSGGELQLADAEWVITGRAGNVLTLGTDASSSPVFKDGALVDLYFWVIGRSVGSISWRVTGSDAAARTITVGEPPGLSAAGVQVGDRGYFARNIDGTGRLDYLEDSAAVALHGVRTGPLVDATDVPDAINLVVNSDLSAWSGGAPSSWSTVGGPTLTQSVDALYVKQGSATAHVQASAAGHGLRQAGIAIAANARRPYTGIMVGLTVISGLVRIQLVNTSTGVVYPQQSNGVITPAESGPYLTISQLLGEDPLPAGTYRLDVLSHGGAAEWYMDAAMVTHVAGDAIPEYSREAAPQVLWQRLARTLLERSVPRVEYRVSVVNLYGIADAYRFEEIRLGDDLKVRDSKLGQTTQRAVELTTGIVDESVLALVLAPSARLRVRDGVFGPPLPSPNGRRGPIGTTGLVKDVPAILHYAAALGEDGLLYISALGTPRTASIEVRLRTSTLTAWPTAPNDTINGRVGTTDGLFAVGGAFYQLIPYDGSGTPGDAIQDVFGVPVGDPSMFEILRWGPEYTDPTGNTVPYGGEVGSAVTHILVYELQRAQGSAGPWDVIESVGSLSSIASISGEVSYVFTTPMEGVVRYWRIRPVSIIGAEVVVGRAIDGAVYPKGAQAPVANLRWTDNGVTLTAWLQLQDRGIPVTQVRGLSQVANGPIITTTTTTRVPGGASVYAGGLLGAGEYEQDAVLDSYRTTRVGFEVTLLTGEVITQWTPAHDRNRMPEFATGLRVEGTVIHVEGDDDTISFEVERLDGTWSKTVDNWTGAVDVALADAAANPGLASNTTGFYRVTLYSDPIADIDVNTLTATSDVTVVNGSPAPPASSWESVTLAEPTVGSADMGITLDADAAPAGSYVTLRARSQVGGAAWEDLGDITAAVSPVLSAPPTASTAYTWATGYTRIAKDYSKPILTMEITATIYDSGDVLLDKVTATKQWYIDPGGS